MAKQIVSTQNAPAPIGPYNQAVKANGFLYVSGQIAIDPKDGKLKTGSIAEETHQVMQNLGAVLRAGNLDFNDVVKISIFMKDLHQFGEVNEHYGQYFPEGEQPARETVEVARLPKDANVEISLIAAV